MTDLPVRPYIAFYDCKTFDCEATTSYKAQQIAIAHFKPPKSKQHMVSVVLADVPMDTSSLGSWL